MEACADDDQSCRYFVKKRQRFCRFPRKTGAAFCSMHVDVDKEVAASNRVRCPLSGDHMVDKSQLVKHLWKCPHARNVLLETLQPFFSHNVASLASKEDLDRQEEEINEFCKTSTAAALALLEAYRNGLNPEGRKCEAQNYEDPEQQIGSEKSWESQWEAALSDHTYTFAAGLADRLLPVWQRKKVHPQNKAGTRTPATDLKAQTTSDFERLFQLIDRAWDIALKKCEAVGDFETVKVFGPAALEAVILEATELETQTEAKNKAAAGTETVTVIEKKIKLDEDNKSHNRRNEANKHEIQAQLLGEQVLWARKSSVKDKGNGNSGNNRGDGERGCGSSLTFEMGAGKGLLSQAVLREAQKKDDDRSRVILIEREARSNVKEVKGDDGHLELAAAKKVVRLRIDLCDFDMGAALDVVTRREGEGEGEGDGEKTGMKNSAEKRRAWVLDFYKRLSEWRQIMREATKASNTLISSKTSETALQECLYRSLSCAGHDKSPELWQRLATDFASPHAVAEGGRGRGCPFTSVQVVGKHVCGAATDLSLKHLVTVAHYFANDEEKAEEISEEKAEGRAGERKVSPSVVGVIASCCFHACDPTRIFGVEFLIECLKEAQAQLQRILIPLDAGVEGESDQEKEGYLHSLLRSICGACAWATGGIVDYEKVRVGLKAKALVFIARLTQLRLHGLQCKVVHFCPRSITPENYAIVAWNSSLPEEALKN